MCIPHWPSYVDFRRQRHYSTAEELARLLDNASLPGKHAAYSQYPRRDAATGNERLMGYTMRAAAAAPRVAGGRSARCAPPNFTITRRIRMKAATSPRWRRIGRP